MSNKAFRARGPLVYNGILMRGPTKARIITAALCAALTALPAYTSWKAAALHGWGARSVKRIPVSYSLLHYPFYMEVPIIPVATGTMRHVSSNTPLGHGRLMAAWYEGSAEGAADVTINTATYDEHTLLWSAPMQTVSARSASRELGRFVRKLGNALVFKDSSERLWLFFATTSFGGWSDCSLNYKLSTDDGATWGPARQLITSPFLNISTNVKNKPVELDDGSLLLPAYHELASKHSLMVRITPMDAWADVVSVDARKMTRSQSAIQPSLIHYGDDRVLTAYMRNMDRGAMLVAQSLDLGQTWGKTEDSALPNPNSGADVVVRPDGSYLAALNWSTSDRRNLKLAVSSDKGKTWRIVKTLEDSPSGGEFSYPYISRTETGIYHVTYTYDRKTIKHVSFNDDWLALQLEGAAQ